MKTRFLSLLVALFLAVAGWAIPTQAGPYKVDVTSDPAVLGIGKATLRITVKAAGKSVSDATVRVLAQMPGMPMGEHEEKASPVAGQPGTYTAPAVFAMAGGYDVRVSVSGPQGSAVATIPVETGKSTVSSAGVDYARIGLWVLVAGVAVLVVLRMRKTGQSVSLKQVFTPSVVWSIALLGVALFVAIYAINHYRRPGSMTPLEAQGMEMSTPAPEGMTPVTLAVAETKPFGATVRYTGQAKGYVEQDIIPRVTGTLIWMPFYVGDKVTKGEVIAKLDTSQLAPELAQQAAGADSANKAVDVARSDYNMAQAGVSEAEAELSQYQGALDEARANLESAKQDKLSADAELLSMQADLATAQAGVTSAEADQVYYAKQAERGDSLLAAGAISQEAAQRKRADSQKADAAANQAHQMVRSAEAKVTAAQANIRKAASEIVAAQKRVVQAQSELMSHHAHVATAKAAAISSSQKISQAQSQARQAAAMVSGATASKGYAIIKAESDGVITDRMISPGTLVNIGQPIVRIAQISPIRLQANVAETDLANVRVGAMVLVSHRDLSEKPYLARVTSVSPSLDPAARTGVVEAVVTNSDRRFLPGQFLLMDISVGRVTEAVTIPMAAVHQVLGDSGETTSSYVWVAVSSADGHATAAKRIVKLGANSGDDVAVLSGLKAGDQVVVQGGQELIEGQMVSPQTSSANGVVAG